MYVCLFTILHIVKYIQFSHVFISLQLNIVIIIGFDSMRATIVVQDKNIFNLQFAQVEGMGYNIEKMYQCLLIN